MIHSDTVVSIRYTGEHGHMFHNWSIRTAK